MTKADIVNSIAAKTGMDKGDVMNVVEAFMESVKTSMVEGNDVFLRGFGTFAVRTRAAKTARDIGKKKTIVIPERQVPTFKPSKKFTEQFGK